LAVIELVWLAWFLIVPLPNANNTGMAPQRVIRRGWLLLRLIPEVVPETTFGESFLGLGLAQLSHFENLPQRVPIVLSAGLIAAAAIGLGDLVLRGLRLEEGHGLAERVALDYGVGAALFGALTLILGRLGWLNPWSCRAGLALVAVVGLVTSRLWRLERPKLGVSSCLLGLVIAPFVVVMLLASMLPSIDFDVLEYHLQAPKEYFQAGRIAFLPHNVYASMPFNVEMLHLLGMEVNNDWWWGGLVGQLLVACFAPATAVLIAATAARAGSARAGWIAAIVYLSTPWVYRLAAIAYVEGPLCFYHGALVWATMRGSAVGGADRWRHWLLVGLLAGSAMGCKYTALVSAGIPFGVLALVDSWWRRSAALLGCYVLGWAIVIGPWLGKNAIDTRNPVYPLAGGIFHSRQWDDARQRQWTEAHGPPPLARGLFWDSLVDVAGRSDWQSPLYVALAPLALLRPGSRRVTLLLWGFVAYLFLTWWLFTHRVDRFWLPLLPPLAILAGLGGDWMRSRLWSLVLGSVLVLALLANLTYISTALAGLNEWTGDLGFLRRDIPQRWNAPLARLDAELPRDARPLLVGQAAVYHLNHIVAYNTVFNPETIELLACGKTAGELHQALKARHLTHIYVDWKEIRRHRQPGGYGFTSFVTPSRFAVWVAQGVLESPRFLGPDQELYRIRERAGGEVPR
jgi:4-amino-4-deoxy-L-arabinose transferase-like glycosyltransferase